MGTESTASGRLRQRARRLMPAGDAPPEGAHIDAGDLRAAMKIVEPALQRGSGMIEAMTGVRITSTHQAAHLTCVNMDGACRAPVKAAGTLDTIVSFRALKDALAGAGGQVGIIGQDDQTVLTIEDMTVRLPMLRAADWPRVAFDGRPILRADKKLAAIIDRARVSASVDDTRPVLTGILLDDEEGKIAATDSFRLFVADMPGEPTDTFAGKKLLVPAKTLVTALKGSDQVTLKLQTDRGRDRLIIDRPDRSWAITLIEGQFAKYTQLVPDYSSHDALTSVVFDADKTADAVAKMCKVLGDKQATTILQVTAGKMVVTCRKQTDQGDSSANVTVNAAGEMEAGPDTIAFRAGLLIDALNTAGESSQVRMQFVRADKPAVLVDADPTSDAVTVLMPFKLNTD